MQFMEFYKGEFIKNIQILYQNPYLLWLSSWLKYSSVFNITLSGCLVTWNPQQL